VLFVDEIHRFNKAQQDAFLPHVEDGTIVLIGATTENPSFEVIGPLLSRARVVVLQELTPEQLQQIISRAVRMNSELTIEPDAIEMLAGLVNGDARVALNGLEAAANLASGKTVTTEHIKQALQKVALHYDKTGEYHYNLISAYIKSMRGGAVDAALFYLARMLASGEDPKFLARRIVIFAAEDIGMAAPAALNLAVSTFMAVERIGMPESQIILSEATIAMSKSPKDRSSADAIQTANSVVASHPNAEVPLHLRNAPTKLMKNLGYNKDYKWQPGFKHDLGFLPDELRDIQIYKPNSEKPRNN
jgi:putative ATPase